MLQLMQSDLHNQEKTVRRLTKAVDDLAHKTDIDEYQQLSEKRQVMVSMLRTTKALAKDAENEVQDKMRQVLQRLVYLDSVCDSTTVRPHLSRGLSLSRLVFLTLSSSSYTMQRDCSLCTDKAIPW